MFSLTKLSFASMTAFLEKKASSLSVSHQEAKQNLNWFVCYCWCHILILMRLKNMARPPASLPPTFDRPLEVSLILGSFVHEPTKFDLFDLFVPPSQTPAPHVEEAKFHELPSIHHTFHPEQKLPPKFVSAVFTALVFSPWAVLLGLVCPARFRIARSR